MAFKIVDKFEFLETQGKTVDGVDIIPARHVVTREAYTLKKLSLKEDSKGRYGNLVNELVMLKEVEGEWVIKCHKMLKTTNNLYLVYDKMEESTLATLIDSKQPLSLKLKESIASQLINILMELKAKGIVNLNITPQTIEIITHRSQNKLANPIVRLNNFEYALLLRQVVDQKILNNLLVSQFIPPEFDLTPPIIGYHCDLYSVGKIMEILGFGKGGSIEKEDRSERMRQINETVCRMIAKDYRKRIGVEELKAIFDYKAPDTHQRQVQRSKTLTTSWKNKQESQTSEENDVCEGQTKRKLTNTISTQATTNPRHPASSSNFRSYCLQILKRRNLSIFLLKCCHFCSQTDLADIDSTIMASFLLLKKSTQVIAQLCKFLMTDHDPYIKIPEKELSSFFKTHDYFKIQSQATKQMSLSKKHLNLMVTKITQVYRNLLQNQNFLKQTKQEEINNVHLKQIILQFLRKSIKNHRIGQLDKQILNYFLLMSYIHDFNTYEKMFDELISQEIIELSGQTLLIKIQQMSSQEILEKLSGIQNTSK